MHPSGRAAIPRLLVGSALAPISLMDNVLKGFLAPGPAGYDLVGEIECFVSILCWLEAFALGCCEAKSCTWGLEKKSLISCAVPLLLFFGDCTSLAPGCCASSISLRLVRNFIPEKVRSGSPRRSIGAEALPLWKMPGPVLGIKVRRSCWTFGALESLLSARPVFLRRLRFKVMWVFSNAVIWTLSSYLSGLVLCLGLLSYFSASFPRLQPRGWGGAKLCCGFSWIS